MTSVISRAQQARRSELWARTIAEIAIASIGIALLVCAIGANQRWMDRHFLPSFLFPRVWYVRLETVARLALAVAGLFLAHFARPHVGRLAARSPSRTLHVAIAALLGIVASEPVLRRLHLQPAEWLSIDEEPRRRADQRLGWTFVPARAGYSTIGGRRIEYALDARGYRVRRVEEPVDPQRPSLLFIGESVMFGEGLTWEESIPAQVGTMMGLQSANLAVHGFASDQAYMRLAIELPTFQRPVAVVSLFMTTLFGRNLDHERPHLSDGLVWQPAVRRWRLESLARLLVPYRSDGLIEHGIATTRDVLRATVDLTRAHRAMPLIVVLQFGQEDEIEQRLRQRILDDGGLPYVFVQIDQNWRLPWDRHPNARAAHAIAEVIAARLQGRGSVF